MYETFHQEEQQKFDFSYDRILQLSLIHIYTLQRMVDREAKRAEGKGVGYDRWAAKHNLKQMAATVTAYQQYGF